MAKKIIKTPKAPLPVGPYNQATVANGFVFCSGQIPIDPKTNEFVKDGVTEQAHQVLKNLTAVLEEAGSSLEKIVKMTVFLKNMGDFQDMNKVYMTYIKDEWAPARSTIEVARLPKDALVEMEAIAVC